MKSKIFVSGCLGGAKIRYNATGILIDDAIWESWERAGRLFHYCPELAAGFVVPRPAAEIVGGTASDVILGDAQVIEENGNDVTDLFVKGAKLALEAAVENGVAMAIMTDGSPSCGITYIDSGNFNGEKVGGNGVLTRMLIDNGIKVFPHTSLGEADNYLRGFEATLLSDI